MSFLQANMPHQLFASFWGNGNRSYKVLSYFIEASRQSPDILIDSAFLAPQGQGGKLRDVKLVYIPQSCDATASCSTTVCDPGVTVPPKAIWFSINECTASQVFTINVDDIRQIDDSTWSFSQYARQILWSKFAAYRRTLATAWINKAYALAGLHADCNETHKIVALDATGRINPLAINNVNQEYADLGFMDPLILGGGELYSWEKIINIGGLNDDGVNIDRISTGAFTYDDGLQGQIFGNLASGNYALTIAPGTFKLVTFSKNAGIFRTADMTSIDDMVEFYQNAKQGTMHGTYLDPETGLMFDLDIRFSDCPEQWNIQWRLEWDMFVLPETVCNDVDCNVNGIMKWRTCAAVVADCPTGQSPSTPVTATTHSWTPTMANIPNVSQSTIDGYNAFQNQPVATANIAALVAYMNDNSNITFTVNGSAIEYTGVEAIAASFNSGAVVATFS